MKIDLLWVVLLVIWINIDPGTAKSQTEPQVKPSFSKLIKQTIDTTFSQKNKTKLGKIGIKKF